MSFGVYLANIYTQLGLIGLATTCAFAWWKGGAPEKLGTLVVAVAWLGGDLLRGLSGQLIPTAFLFASDTLLSFGLLIIAVRYSSLWVGLAMLFESFCFALHGIQLGDVDAPRWHGMIVYLLLNNIFNYLVLVTLATGTLATMHKRMRDRKLRALAQAKAADRAARQFTAPPLPLANNF